VEARFFKKNKAKNLRFSMGNFLIRIFFGKLGRTEGNVAFLRFKKRFRRVLKK